LFRKKPAAQRQRPEGPFVCPEDKARYGVPGAPWARRTAGTDAHNTRWTDPVWPPAGANQLIRKKLADMQTGNGLQACLRVGRLMDEPDRAEMI
jgi:hypothetical protein